jgi:hypothetical protein
MKIEVEFLSLFRIPKNKYCSVVKLLPWKVFISLFFNYKINLEIDDLGNTN